MKRATRKSGDHVDLECTRACSCPCRPTCFSTDRDGSPAPSRRAEFPTGDATLPPHMGSVSTTADTHGGTQAGLGFAWRTLPLNRRSGNQTLASHRDRFNSSA